MFDTASVLLRRLVVYPQDFTEEMLQNFVAALNLPGLHLALFSQLQRPVPFVNEKIQIDQFGDGLVDAGFGDAELFRQISDTDGFVFLAQIQYDFQIILQ